jgi:hypothetical protein
MRYRRVAKLKVPALPSEEHRTRLIEEIASMLPRRELPPEARQAALTLIEWLARRLPHDTSPPDGIDGPVRR